MTDALFDRNDVASGDPEEIRGQARGLRTVSENIDLVTGLLRCVSTHGVWESDAGRAFADRVDDTPNVLDDVSARLFDTAGLIDPYADQLADSQRRMGDLEDDYEAARRTMDAREKELETLPPEDPDRPRLERERAEAAGRANRARADFEAESDEAVGTEKRMAGKLCEVGADLADPGGYDVLEGITNAGHAASSNPISIIARPVALAGIAEPIGMAGRRAVYGEGSWSDVGKTSAWYAADVVSFGAGRAVRWTRKTFGDASTQTTARPAKASRWSDEPIPVATNPIAKHRLRDISSARTRTGRLGQTVKHDVADKIGESVKQKTGLADIERFHDDWAAVAGSTTHKVVVVVDHSARQTSRLSHNAKWGRTAAESTGTDGTGRDEQAQDEQDERAEQEEWAEQRGPERQPGPVP